MRRLPVFVVISVLLCAAALSFQRERRHVRGFVETRAEIVELRSERVTRGDGRQHATDAHAVVAYKLHGRTERFGTQFFGVPEWRKGQVVMALVSRDEPGVGRVKRVDDLHPRSAGFAGLAALCAIALGIDSLVTRRARRGGRAGRPPRSAARIVDAERGAHTGRRRYPRARGAR